jgi:hypothetical protein
MELRDRIAYIISTHEFLEEVGDKLLFEESRNLATDILAIPIIRDALAAYEKNNSTYLKAKLGHSIGTRPQSKSEAEPS